MPAWNLGDIMSTATKALGNRGDITLSEASLWANQAQLKVWESLPFNEQEAVAVSSTTVNEDKITLPSDFDEILVVSRTSGGIGDPVPLNLINPDQLAGYSNHSGIPVDYIEYSTWLELRPVPDSAYSIEIRYRKQLSDMSEATDAPSVSTRYRYPVMLKTKELLAEHVILDSDMAQEANNQYMSEMRSLPSDRAKRNRENRNAGMSLPRIRGQRRRSSTYSFDRSDC